MSKVGTTHKIKFDDQFQWAQRGVKYHSPIVGKHFHKDFTRWFSIKRNPNCATLLMKRLRAPQILVSTTSPSISCNIYGPNILIL